MPKGREEKFRYNRDGRGAVTAVRKGSDADKYLQKERKAFKDAADDSDIFKRSSDKYKRRVADDAAYGMVGHTAKRKAQGKDAPFFKHTQKDN